MTLLRYVEEKENSGKRKKKKKVEEAIKGGEKQVTKRWITVEFLLLIMNI